MSREEKIYYLKKHYLREWELACISIWGRLQSERCCNSICVCGKPTIEGHVRACRVFSQAIDTLALEHLSHRLPSN